MVLVNMAIGDDEGMGDQQHDPSGQGQGIPLHCHFHNLIQNKARQNTIMYSDDGGLDFDMLLFDMKVNAEYLLKMAEVCLICICIDRMVKLKF